MKDVFCFNTQPIPLFDSHCHIQDPQFDEDREEVIARAREVLDYIVCVGWDLESSKQAIALAEKHPDFIYATVGNHPYDAEKSMEGFEELLKHERVVAVGETGIDYVKCEVDPEVQKASFKKHCELAVKFDLPVIIHTRETDECYPDAKQILIDTGCKKAIFHCFSGSRLAAEDAWKNGWKTSFSLNTTYPKNEELRQIMADCPPELLLRETDSPWLAPQGKRGERNEPGFLA